MEKSKRDSESLVKDSDSMSYADREQALYHRWLAEGRKLIHYCHEWDSMLICESSPEIIACTCTFEDQADNELRDWYGRSPDSPHAPRSSMPAAIGEAVEPTTIHPTDFLNDRGAPAPLGSEVQKAEAQEATLLSFPIAPTHVLTLDGVFNTLRKDGVENSVTLYFGEGGDTCWLQSGTLMRKDVLWMLETLKHRMMTEQEQE